MTGITTFTIKTYSTAWAGQHYDYPSGSFCGLPIICSGRSNLSITITNDKGFRGNVKVYSPSGNLLIDLTPNDSGESLSGSCSIAGYDYLTVDIRTPSWGDDGEGTVTFTMG